MAFTVNPSLLVSTIEEFASLDASLVAEHMPSLNFPALIRKKVFTAHQAAIAAQMK